MRFVVPAVLSVLVMLAPGVSEIRAAGLEAGKDCHVILTCNFKRNAPVRGCLSSYSCRQCEFIKRATVSIDGVRRTEWRSSCDWGSS